MKNKERETNIELFRIILMFFIILFHFQNKMTSDEPFISYRILRTIGIAGGAIGVDCFVMIYAWYNESNPQKNIKKTLRLLVITAEYLLIFLGVGLLINPEVTMKKAYEGLLQPLWLNRYWYVTAYIVLLLISPILDCIIMQLSIKQILHSVIFMFIIQVGSCFLGHEADYINDVWLMVLIYFLTKYIKISELQVHRKIYIIGFLCWGVTVVFDMLQFDMPESLREVLANTVGYAGRYSAQMIFSALALFVFFNGLVIKQSSLINKIASLIFGVYLFHENPIFNVSAFVYILDPYQEWKFRLLFACAAIIVIYIGGIVFELLRKTMMSRLENKLIRRRCDD